MFVMLVRIMFMFLPWHVTHDDAIVMAAQQHLQTAKCKMKISRRVVSRDVISPARARDRAVGRARCRSLSPEPWPTLATLVNLD